MHGNCSLRKPKLLLLAILTSFVALPTFSHAQTLGFVTFSGPGTHTDFTLRLVEEWAAARGVTIRATTMPFVQLRDRIMVSMIASDASVDFYYMDSGAVPLFARGLYPLNDFIEQDNFDLDIMSRSLIDLYTVDGNIYAIPHESDTPLFVYREDLFEHPGEMEAFTAAYGRPLSPPETFDELQELAEFFTRQPGETLKGEVLTQDFFGIALSGRTYISSTRLWQMYLHGFGGRTLDADLRVTLNDAAGIDALRFLTNLVIEHNVVPSGVLTVGTPEIVVLMNEGRVAMAPTYPTGMGIGSRPGMTFNSAPFFPATGKGWAIGIAGHSQHPELVWDLIKYINSRESQLQFGLLGAEPTRFDVLADPDLLAERPILEAMAETHRRSLPQPQIPELAYIWDIESRPIADVIGGRYSVEDALARAAAEIEALLERAGYYE